MKSLSIVNRARCISPDGFNHPMSSWSPAEWTNAVAGEAGEACNLAKKLLRFRDGVAGNNKPEDKDQNDLRRRITEELADVVIYCDLAIAAVGGDMATVVREVFNRKSREIGSPHLLPDPPVTIDPLEVVKLYELACGWDADAATLERRHGLAEAEVGTTALRGCADELRQRLRALLSASGHVPDNGAVHAVQPAAVASTPAQPVDEDPEC